MINKTSKWPKPILKAYARIRLRKEKQISSVERRLRAHIGKEVQLHNNYRSDYNSGFKGMGILSEFEKLKGNKFRLHLKHTEYETRDTITVYNIDEDYIYFR